jgi:hypothetical protein
MHLSTSNVSGEQVIFAHHCRLKVERGRHQHQHHAMRRRSRFLPNRKLEEKKWMPCFSLLLLLLGWWIILLRLNSCTFPLARVAYKCSRTAFALCETARMVKSGEKSRVGEAGYVQITCWFAIYRSGKLCTCSPSPPRPFLSPTLRINVNANSFRQGTLGQLLYCLCPMKIMLNSSKLRYI